MNGLAIALLAAGLALAALGAAGDGTWNALALVGAGACMVSGLGLIVRVKNRPTR